MNTDEQVREQVDQVIAQTDRDVAELTEEFKFPQDHKYTIHESLLLSALFASRLSERRLKAKLERAKEQLELDAKRFGMSTTLKHCEKWELECEAVLAEMEKE